MKRYVSLRKRIISLVLVCFSLLQTAVFAAPTQTDEIWGRFSERSIYKGMKAWYGDKADFPTVSTDPEGWLLSTKSKKYHIYVDIEDKLMYNLTDQAVEVEVDYYDEGQSTFVLCYDGLETYDTGEVNSEFVDLTDTKGWKTHTFFLQDAVFANGLNGADFRISMGGRYLGNGYTKHGVRDDIVFGGVRVRYAGVQSPVHIKISSEKKGNVFFEGDQPSFTVNYENKLSEAVNLKARYTVIDSTGDEVIVKEEPISFKGKEKRDETLTFDINRFELYWLRVELFNEDETKYCMRDAEFSYVTTTHGKYLNRFVGTSTMMDYLDSVFTEDGERLAVSRYGEADYTSDMLINAGYGRDRLNMTWKMVYNSTNGFSISERFKDRLDIFRDKGIDLEVILGVSYTGGNLPGKEGDGAYNMYDPTPEFEKDYKDYIRYVVRQTKDYASSYIIGNENDHNATPAAQKKPENYYLWAKWAYETVKEEYPEAVVKGYGLTTGSQSWFEKSIELGTADYFDYADLHLYSIYKTIEDQDIEKRIKTFQDAAAKYGVDLGPVAVGEIGWYRPRFGALSVYDISQQFPILYMTAQTSDFVYDLTDYTMIEPWVENNGHLRAADVSKQYGLELPNGALRDYLTISCWNNNFGADCTFVDKLTGDNTRLWRFNRARDGKQFVSMWTKKGPEFVTLSLGTNEIELMDILGNSRTVYSDDGIFTFNISEDMQYIIGDFKDFRMMETPKFDWSAAALSVLENSTDALKVSMDNAQDYTIEAHTQMLGEYHGSVTDESGITASLGVGTVKATMANRLLHGNPGRSQFLLHHKDEVVDKVTLDIKKDGKLYATATIPITTHPSLEARSFMTPISMDALRSWNASIVLDNLSKQPVSGTLEILAPAALAETVKPKPFTIAAQSTITETCAVPSSMLGKEVQLQYRVTLDNGEMYEFNDACSSFCAIYTNTPPTIDGVMNDGEWVTQATARISPDSYRAIVTSEPFGGADDLSGTVNLMWDKDYLYMAIKMKDNVHCQTEHNGSTSWKGDCVQVGFITLDTSEAFTRYNLSLADDGNTYTYLAGSEVNSFAKMDISDKLLKAVVARSDDGYTIYETRILWEELLNPADMDGAGEATAMNEHNITRYETGRVAKSGEHFDFAIMVNDHDGVVRKGYVEYGADVSGNKPTQPIRVLLYGGNE